MENSSAPKEGAVEREPRGARRKRATRAKLIEAAFRLMAGKGMEGVAINEITEAADVGFGSFYNHFDSKEAIYEAVVESVFEDFADSLDRLVAGVTDSAEVVSVSIRHTVMRAEREPLWGQFLIREALSLRSIERGLGRRLFRDIRNGIQAGRFASADPFMSFLSVGGTVLVSIAVAITDVRDPQLSRDHLPERSAATALRILNVDPNEADEIARRPLPR